MMYERIHGLSPDEATIQNFQASLRGQMILPAQPEHSAYWKVRQVEIEGLPPDHQQ